MLDTGTSATSWPRAGAEHGLPRGRDHVVVDTAGGAVASIVGKLRRIVINLEKKKVREKLTSLLCMFWLSGMVGVSTMMT